MSHRTPTLALFRMVLLTLLALGMCLQPTFAAACAIDDVRAVLGNDVGASVMAANVDGSGSPSDCCSNPLCSDCCLHAAGSFHCSGISVNLVMPMLHSSPRVDEFRPRDYPVDIRPPITR